MPVSVDMRTPEAAEIEAALRSEFPNVAAYRYNSASLRVRVIDERFRGRSITEREKLVLPLLHALPEETQADIMILLLLAPEETDRSLMNLEFENPSQSML